MPFMVEKNETKSRMQPSEVVSDVSRLAEGEAHKMQTAQGFK